MKTEFQFRSHYFNISDPRDYFINPSCYGDDLAEWMIRKLRERGIETSSVPGQEDFGWYLTFIVDGVEHCIVLGFQPNDLELGDCWIGWIERHVGFVGSLIGGRNGNIRPQAIAVVNDILETAREIEDLTWQDH